MKEKTITNNLGTQGITGLLFLSAHSDRIIWHLDVGLSYPKAEIGFKGWAVRP